MDRLRLAAESTVRRVAGIGLLIIATVAGLLGRQPVAALDATTLLLTVEALILWQCGAMPPPLPFGRRELWLTLPGQERRHREIFAALLAENFRAYGRRFAVPAGMAWIADIATHFGP